jgi:hypothetical protein
MTDESYSKVVDDEREHDWARFVSPKAGHELALKVPMFVKLFF